VQTLVRQAAPREVGLVLDVLCTLGVGVTTAMLPRGRLLALPLLLVLPVQLASAFGGLLWSVVGPLVAWCAVGLVRLRYDRVRRS
jgi:hypothetical protein